MKVLEVVKISDVITSPWSESESPKFRGWSYGVAFDTRKLEREEQYLDHTGVSWFNAYSATYQFVALCTSEESAQAAKRLLELV